MTSSKQVGSATVTMFVEVASLQEADKKFHPSSRDQETCSPRFLLDGTKVLRLDPEDSETQEQQFTFDRVLGPEHIQEAELEFLGNIRAVLGSLSRGYSVSVLIRGREVKHQDLVPQLLAMLFEEIQPPDVSEPSLRTLSLVQLNSSGKNKDLLLPGAGDLTLLDVYPLGLVVEGASEAEVLDSKTSCQLYLKAMEGVDSTCSLLTVTVSCLGPRTTKKPWARGMWWGSLRVLQLPEAPDCPLLLALAGKTSKAHVGSLPWIVTELLFGNSYSNLLLHLDPGATPVSLLLASLEGAAGARALAPLKQVSPILWYASEEMQARRAAVQDLRSGLSGTSLQESQLTQLCLALRELKVLKKKCRYWETRLLKGAGTSAPRLPNQQPPDVSLQFMLARAHRQLLQKHHQSQIQEEQRCSGQDKETATEQASDLFAENQNWRQDHKALVLQLEALRVERDAAEEDLEALYELYVQGSRAQTCHILQVFRACQGLWKDRVAAQEFHHRLLLAGVLQDAVSLATQNQQLQVWNKQLQKEITEGRKKV